MTVSLCRICLNGNNKTRSFENIKLQEIYEKLSSSKVHTGDGRPEAVCYICHSQLLRCWKFSEMVCRSEKLLNDLIGDRIRITKKNVSKRHHGLRFNLAVRDTLFLTINGVRKEEQNVTKEIIVYEFIERNNVPMKNNDVNDLNTKSNGTSLSITDQKAFHCQKCDKKFKKKCFLSLHMRVHTDKRINMSKNDKPYPYIEKEHVERQMISDGKEYNFVCPTCNKAFKTKCYLTRHMSTHMTGKRYDCKECGKTFVKKPSLNNHMRFHTGEGLLTCDHCGKQFYSKSNLIQHMVIHGSVKGFVCEICQKSLSTRSTLKTHMLIHTNEKLYTCHDCGKLFKQRCNLVSHIKIHTGEKPYACSSCNMRFCRQDYLKKHMITHLIAKKSFECSICNLKFSRKDTLSNHTQTHTDQSFLYACFICEKPFRNKRDMKFHLRIHTVKKFFECKECHKIFTTQSHLSRHKKCVHIGIKPFVCFVCNEMFHRKDNMRSHMAKRHSIN